MPRRSLLLSLIVLWLAGGVSPVLAVTDEEVGKAIDQMKAYLYSKQDADGGWDSSYKHNAAYPGAATSLIVYSLLTSGESVQRAELDKAVVFLRTCEPQGVYQIGLRSHVWSQLPDKYLPMLKSDANWLEGAADKSDSTFGYTADGKGYDHSNTQYGVLGLWEAAKRDIPVSGNFWPNVIKHWIEAQTDDGGWAYKASDGGSYGSMTCAGLTAMLVAQQEQYRQLNKAEARTAASINKGIAWMDKNFDAARNPRKGGWHMYYLYGVERVALGSGAKDFGGKDWYSAGAQVILKDLRDGAIGKSAVDTAFALLFLSRGRVPVWITKLELTDAPWNNRPNDVYFFNDYLGKYGEKEVNWQVLGLERPVEELRSTPILYVSSDSAINLSDAHKKNLKRYLDLGGLLVANPENSSNAFQQSIQDLAKELYPDLKGMQPLANQMDGLRSASVDKVPALIAASHPLFSVQHAIGQSDAGQILGLNNGARDLILMPARDWGMAWQGGKEGDSAFKLGANLFVMATDRGVIENRLVERFEKPSQDNDKGTIKVVRARWGDKPLLEPLGLEPLVTRVHNRAQLEVQVSDESLSKIGDSDAKVVHLAGIGDYKLTPDEREAIKRYVAAGGLMVVESVGGKGAFANSIEKQLTEVLGKNALPLETQLSEKMLTGSGITGAYNVVSVEYRRYSVFKTHNIGTAPSLFAFYQNNRPAVVISRDDLTLGLLDVRHWGILGFTPESARQIMTNIVLFANTKSEPTP